MSPPVSPSKSALATTAVAPVAVREVSSQSVPSVPKTASRSSVIDMAERMSSPKFSTVYSMSMLHGPLPDTVIALATPGIAAGG